MSIKSQTGTAVTAGLLGVHGSLGEGDFHNPELTAILSLSFVDIFSIVFLRDSAFQYSETRSFSGFFPMPHLVVVMLRRLLSSLKVWSP